MFCNLCEETAKGFGCTVRGVCGKDAETAGLQDVLIYTLKGLSVRNLVAMKKGGGNSDAAASLPP
jgi:hydroxylamine reductase